MYIFFISKPPFIPPLIKVEDPPLEEWGKPEGWGVIYKDLSRYSIRLPIQSETIGFCKH